MATTLVSLCSKSVLPVLYRRSKCPSSVYLTVYLCTLHTDLFEQKIQISLLSEFYKVICATNASASDDNVGPRGMMCSTLQQTSEGLEIGCKESERQDKVARGSDITHV